MPFPVRKHTVPLKCNVALIRTCRLQVRMNTCKRDECDAPLISDYLTACNLRIQASVTLHLRGTALTSFLWYQLKTWIRVRSPIIKRLYT